MAIALLITQNGMALVKLFLSPKFPTYLKANARRNAKAIIGIKAQKKDFLINPNLVLLSSSSNEPSSTIKISPIVPKTGRTDEKLGSRISNHTVSCLTTQPKSNKRITEGTLVFEDVRSNKYAMSKRTQNVIIIVIVIVCWVYVD
jgi:hypothetical protein